jgi:DNA/RNA-binding domain of Phe-tRNA-synthetase-like protein
MLDSIVVEPEIWRAYPGFAVLLMTAEGLRNGPPDSRSRALLTAAAKESDHDAEHVAAWQEAYRAFGANPRRARPSVDALLRRRDALPEINQVVDAYNAVSVGHVLPVGGEDIDAYEGPARLASATGDEVFQTVKDGAPVLDHPEPGEVVWRDDAGVTCRRWNWRQCTRTRITEKTKNAVFILERLEPYPLERLRAAGDALADDLRAVAPDVRIATRLLVP